MTNGGRTMRAVTAGAVAVLLPCVAGHAAAPPSLLPLPAKIVAGEGAVLVANGAGIAVDDAQAEAAARLLVDHVATERGIALRMGGERPLIRFVRDPAIAGGEAYRLSVAADGIRIAASAKAGFVYGAMTLAQLLAPDRMTGQAVRVPAMTIEDSPRFVWRGLMVDVARHFEPIGELRRIVDQMAAVKLNTLHLHLSDDQGWRMEIKAFPKLTAVGGWRIPPSTGGAPGPAVGGFYTQAELKALVAYAADRGITIVPEIDLPGHAQALVAAYPELGILGDTPAVSHDWGVNPYLFNPGPKGVAFVEAVLDEVMAVFPGQYVHLGGDEAVKDQWERSPVVQAQIKALGVKGEDGLQSWMIERFGTYLARHGRRLIGWDEILEGGLPPSASVMSWRGEKGAVDAANAGHDVVLSPGGTLYLDNLQSDAADEPPGRLAIQTLANVYAYEPMPAGIAPDKAAHVLGAQGNAWTEYLVTPYQLEHAIFPRAAAVAEMGWTTKDQRDFAGFVPRAALQSQRWRRAGVEVADSAFAVRYTLTGTRGEALRAGRTTVTLATQAGMGTIRYTTDGSMPSVRSAAYTAPIVVAPGAPVRATAFDAAGDPLAAPRAFDGSRAALLTRTASEMVACPAGALGLRVPLKADATANGPAYNVNIFDTCTAYPAAPLDVARHYDVEIARLARNYGLAHEASALRAHYAVSAHGELLVQVGCVAAAKALAAGDKTARPIAAGAFPLPDPDTAPQRLRFAGNLPAIAGDRDICFQFTSPLSDPFYAVERVMLSERAR